MLKTNAYAGLGQLNGIVATYNVWYNAYNDGLSMVQYSIDQMQGIKLMSLKPIRFQP